MTDPSPAKIQIPSDCDACLIIRLLYEYSYKSILLRIGSILFFLPTTMLLIQPLLTLSLLLLLLLLVVVVASGTKHDDANNHLKMKKKKPHILMIVVDDLGSHDLGMHGTDIQTPHSDRLAQEGIYLQEYYVLPYCSPTRASLLSGMYPLHTGIHTPIPDDSTAGLPLQHETLADLLKTSGYQTHAIGKWHLGYAKWEFTPTFRGFDSFYGFYRGGEDYFLHSSKGAYDLRYDARPNCGEGCSQIVDERGNYSTHVFTRQTIQIIQNYHSHHDHDDDNSNEEESKPLFLYLAFQAVHAPDQVPSSYTERYANQNWTQIRKTYAGMLTAADEGIGNVTEALKQAGIWDDTLVIFTTDNGGPTSTCAVQGSSNYPKRGGKCTIWEGGTTGDAFLSGPALSKLGLPTSARFPHLFHVVDWMPTLAEIVGAVPKNNKIDGKSQLTGLKQNIAIRDHVFVGYAYAGYSTNQWYGPAIRHGQWKLIQGTSAGPDEYDIAPHGSEQPLPGGADNSTYLLYDLALDGGERHNVADRYPAIVHFLKSKLKEYQQSYVPPQPNTDKNCPFMGYVNTSIGPTW
jgi:arylsulfatase A-like enzyme